MMAVASTTGASENVLVKVMAPLPELTPALSHEGSVSDRDRDHRVPGAWSQGRPRGRANMIWITEARSAFCLRMILAENRCTLLRDHARDGAMHHLAR